MNMTTAKVFMNGRSQAIRLPKEFRVSGDEVYITKEKGKIILYEKSQKSWAEIISEMPAFPDFDVKRKAISEKPREVRL
ncbi:MAG: AbrB/MazE/SpoVT family DNA-binding domain-containing protein [Spirochaetaceae bacterium]|nr:AbrB/MazE/SpoVT family DNA-binding domain-containing protein [Spirochaetaceae bacterium]